MCFSDGGFLSFSFVLFFFLKKKGRKRSLRRNRYKVLEKCESGGGGTCEHTCQRFSPSASASFMSVSASGTSMSEVFSQRRNCKIGWWVSGFSAAEPDYFRSFVVVELTIMFIWEENLANFYCFLGIEYHCKIILWKTRSTQASIWQFDPNETVSFSYLTDVWWTCNITPKEILESLFFMLHSPTFTEWRDTFHLGLPRNILKKWLHKVQGSVDTGYISIWGEPQDKNRQERRALLLPSQANLVALPLLTKIVSPGQSWIHIRTP